MFPVSADPLAEIIFNITVFLPLQSTVMYSERCFVLFCFWLLAFSFLILMRVGGRLRLLVPGNGLLLNLSSKESSVSRLSLKHTCKALDGLSCIQ